MYIYIYVSFYIYFIAWMHISHHWFHAIFNENYQAEKERFSLNRKNRKDIIQIILLEKYETSYAHAHTKDTSFVCVCVRMMIHAPCGRFEVVSWLYTL